MSTQSETVPANGADAAPPPPPIDAEAETAEDTPQAKRPLGQKKQIPPAAPPPPMARLNREDEAHFRDYFKGLAGGMPFQLKVERRRPEQVKVNGKMVNCAGIIATHDDLIDEEFIRENYGGGTYLLRLMVQMGETQQLKFAGSRQIKIPGEPKVDDVFMNDTAGPVVAAGTDPTAGKLVDSMVKRSEMLEQRLLDGAGKPPPGIDPMLVELIRGPVQAENTRLSEALKEMRAEMRELRSAQATKPAGDEYKDKFLDKMIDGDNARITALRATHESEIRQLQTAMTELERRLRDQHERDLSKLEKAHDRELSNMKQSHEISSAGMKTSNEIAMGAINNSATVQVKLLEAEVKRLEKDNDAMKVEIRALRDKKDIGPLEALKIAAEVKDLVTGDKEEPDEKGKIQQFAEAVGVPDLVKSLAGRIMTAGQPEQQQQQQIPIGARFQDASGATYVMTTQGAVPIKQLRRPGRRPGAPAPAGAAGAPAGDGGVPPPPPEPLNLDPVTLRMAVTQLENAHAKQMDPATVAQSVRAMAPAEIIRAIQERGVDAFLDQVAGLDGNSPLAAQSGRNFLRKIAKALNES